MFVCFVFIWETGLFVLYFCLMNNCSDGSDEVSFFLSFFPAGFSNLMEIYRRFIVTKIPKWFLSYSSQRVVIFCFWSVMLLRFDDFFFFLHNVPENVLFFLLLFRNFRKRKYSIQNRKWHIWLFFRWTAVQV